ncbi:MAG: dihydroorotase [Acidobacteria bacterium 21-70-11]|nr:MAG: dihydroorotase [Acidobacteria bacterium 21-70-11]OYW05695.1 MAG: dihydroorotase [Acidobacteria bacterium 37-71-11]HQT94751.1 dihydroorotase [Thermoanaerobaculaceae bacterium]HQU34152.1 dihydroorotase [Thermoanaerobaculaceae bacterium]
MSRLLIKHGRVVDPTQRLDEGLWVLIADGKVARLAERIEDRDAEVFDATGLVVAPGFVDVHTHLREPGFEYKETIATGSAAAVAGGFTAVCSMPNTQPVNDNAAVTEFIRGRAAAAGLARVYPIGAVSKGLQGDELAEMGEMARAGAVAFSDDGKPVHNAYLMRRALEYAQLFDVPVVDHCEDPNLAAKGVMHEGAVATRLGLRGIPAAAEEVMVARDVVLAGLTGGRLHVAHVSTSGALDRVREGKAKGVAVTCEVTPHHLALTDQAVADSEYDTDTKVNPPLRSADHVAALVQGVLDGAVDCLATDHAPHHADEKVLEFDLAPFGVVGLETAVPVTYDLLVRRHKLPLRMFIALWSSNPVRVFGLPGGSLKVGSPADITLLDLEARLTVNPDRFRSLSRNTPFAGQRLKGWPAATLVGGKAVWRRERR